MRRMGCFLNTFISSFRVLASITCAWNQPQSLKTARARLVGMKLYFELTVLAACVWLIVPMRCNCSAPIGSSDLSLFRSNMVCLIRSSFVLVGVPVWLLSHGQFVKLRSVQQPQFDRRFHRSNLPVLDCRIRIHKFQDDAGNNAGAIYPVVRGP